MYSATFTADPAPVKALNMLGHPVGGVQLPLVDIEEREGPSYAVC